MDTPEQKASPVIRPTISFLGNIEFCRLNYSYKMGDLSQILFEEMIDKALASGWYVASLAEAKILHPPKNHTHLTSAKAFYYLSDTYKGEKLLIPNFIYYEKF